MKPDETPVASTEDQMLAQTNDFDEFEGGKSLTDFARESEQEAQELLTALDEEARPPLSKIVKDFRETVTESETANFDDFPALIARQARMLDATFNYFLDNADQHSARQNVEMALQTQRQVLRSVLGLCALENHKNKKIPGTN